MIPLMGIHYNPLGWDRWTAAWAFWIVWFVFWETYAIIEMARTDGEVTETFSDHIWFLRDTGPSIVIFTVVMLTLWLVYHFVFEGRH